MSLIFGEGKFRLKIIGWATMSNNSFYLRFTTNSQHQSLSVVLSIIFRITSDINDDRKYIIYLFIPICSQCPYKQSLLYK